ncbi:MAG TPA: sugar ABC transporter substrate-binding protein [Ktedonobacteraceae bacterium]|nr:sugar ABC transporter substrate-binding protein [Ktedonobacteraceae bacterium]
MSQKYASSSMTRRRFLRYSGATAGAAAFGGSLLAACGATGGSSSGPSLTQWYHQYGEAGTEQAVFRYAKEYKKANVSVKWKPGTGNIYPNAVTAALLGSGAPDVFELGVPTVDLIKGGKLEPLDDLYNGVKSDYTDATLKGLSYNGKIYGVQIVVDTTALFYRKSLLQKAGLQPPKTMDDLIAATKKLTNGNMKGLYIGQDGGPDALHQFAVFSSGGELVTKDNQLGFNNANTAAMFEKFVELNKTGGLLIAAPTYYWDPSSLTQGLAAMQFTGLWNMRILQKAFGDDIGAVPFPTLNASTKPYMSSGGWAEMVNAKGKNVQAAKDFVKWLWIGNQADQTDFNQSYGFHIPPRLSIAANATNLKSGTAADIVSYWKQYGVSTPVLWDGTMDTALSDAMASVVKNGANPQSALKQAADKCQAELSKLV